MIRESRAESGLASVGINRLCPELAEASQKIGNTHPGLIAVVSEYAELVKEPLETMDVTSLWAVGAGLLANCEAYSPGNLKGVMAAPLEPDHFALLQQCAALHGAFILGFARGRELTEKSDHSRLSPDILDKIIPAAKELLALWYKKAALVEEQTRNFFGAIEAGLIEPSWTSARASYAAYAVTRNALIAVGQALNKFHNVASTVVGNIALYQVDPGFTQTTLWLQFMVQQAPNIAMFCEPFPELKTWLPAMVKLVQSDQPVLRSKPKT